jgi:copper chaperone CopZ
VEFTVEGLDCPVWCAVRLSNSIDSLDGARVESIDQKTGKVIVRHDPARQNVEVLRKLIDARGFTVQASEPVEKR